jgi:hypothetical protein
MISMVCPGLSILSRAPPSRPTSRLRTMKSTYFPNRSGSAISSASVLAVYLPLARASRSFSDFGRPWLACRKTRTLLSHLATVERISTVPSVEPSSITQTQNLEKSAGECFERPPEEGCPLKTLMTTETKGRPLTGTARGCKHHPNQVGRGPIDHHDCAKQTK